MAKKSATRTAFEKAFAAARKKHGGDGGTFTFKGKKYTTDHAKKKKPDNTRDESRDFDFKSEKPKNKRPGFSKANKYEKGGFKEDFLLPPIPEL